MSRSEMSNEYRAEFDIPRDICYLNACYMTPQPRRVVESAIRGATRRSQPWSITPADFFSEVELLRAAFARLVNCSPENIAIVPSAGYGVSCAAKNLTTNPGDTILALGDQFPSNYYAWRRQALVTGAEFHNVNKEVGQPWSESLLEAIERLGDDIAIGTLEGHHWASAEYIDLERVIPALRDVGARVVLDLTQTIGAYPIDIRRLAPDFVVAAAYKWQFCPYGIAFLYVDEKYFDGVSIEEPWMDRDGAEDFSRLAEFTDLYQSGARRFDVSAKSSFSNIAGALSATVAAATRAPHFQGARLPAIDPRRLAAQLIENGVYASVRGDYLRIAPHLYTDDEDLARLDTALQVSLSQG